MPASKAQQRAVSKYMKENYDVFQIRMPKGRKAELQAHAQKQGESLNGFISRAIDRQIERDTSQKSTGTPTEAATALEGMLSSDTLKAAHRAAQKNGEDVPSFIARSVDMEVRRDKAAWSLSVNPATGKEETKGGKDHPLGGKWINHQECHIQPDWLLIYRNDVKTHKTVEKNARMLEARICKKMNDIIWLQESHEWPDLQCVFAVERTVICRGRKSQETSFYIANKDAPAEKLLEFVRGHWKIESMHWMLDIVFLKDASKFLSEYAHKTLNMTRKYALAIHKNFLMESNDRSTIKSSMLSCLINLDCISQFLEIL